MLPCSVLAIGTFLVLMTDFPSCSAVPMQVPQVPNVKRSKRDVQTNALTVTMTAATASNQPETTHRPNATFKPSRHTKATHTLDHYGFPVGPVTRGTKVAANASVNAGSKPPVYSSTTNRIKNIKTNKHGSPAQLKKVERKSNTNPEKKGRENGGETRKSYIQLVFIAVPALLFLLSVVLVVYLYITKRKRVVSPAIPMENGTPTYS